MEKILLIAAILILIVNNFSTLRNLLAKKS